MKKFEKMRSNEDVLINHEQILKEKSIPSFIAQVKKNPDKSFSLRIIARHGKITGIKLEVDEAFPPGD